MTTVELRGEVSILTDPIAVAGTAAQWISEQSALVDPFRIALSGGATPRFLYEALASSAFKNGVDWSRWHVYFGDERAVSPEDVHSNYRLVRDALLSKVPIPLGQVHRMEAEAADLDRSASEYSQLLEAGCGAPPRLDVVLLGLGSDGHTASLFPGTAALDVAGSWATRGRADFEPFDRITLTFPAINAAAHVAFLVTGSGKSEALHGFVEGTVPAARVRPDEGGLLWFLDIAAANSLH